MTVAFDNKCRNTEELCREQGIKFIPIVAESLGAGTMLLSSNLESLAVLLPVTLHKMRERRLATW